MEEKKRLGIGSVYHQVPAKVSICHEDCSMWQQKERSLNGNTTITWGVRRKRAYVDKTLFHFCFSTKREENDDSHTGVLSSALESSEPSGLLMVGTTEAPCYTLSDFSPVDSEFCRSRV